MKHGDAIDSPDGRYVWIDDGVSPAGWYSCFWWGSKPDQNGGHTKGELTKPYDSKASATPMPDTLKPHESIGPMKAVRPDTANRRTRRIWAQQIAESA